MAVVVIAVIYAIVYDRSALAPSGSGILGSISAVFASVTNGITTVLDGIIKAVVNAVTGAVSSAGSYIYKHTIGAL